MSIEKDSCLEASDSPVGGISESRHFTVGMTSRQQPIPQNRQKAECSEIPFWLGGITERKQKSSTKSPTYP